MGFIFFRNFFVATPVVPVILLWRVLTYYIHIVFGGLTSLVSPERPLDKWREKGALVSPAAKRRWFPVRGASGITGPQSRALAATFGVWSQS